MPPSSTAAISIGFSGLMGLETPLKPKATSPQVVNTASNLPIPVRPTLKRMPGTQTQT